MNILLPKKYEYYDKDGRLCAEVVDGVLKLYRYGIFKHVMYDMTYKLYGTKCVYCGKKADSIDHRYPQNFGGPSITNNLYPTCRSCNNEKANMLEEEYKYYCSLQGKTERKEYLKSLKKVQDDRKYGVLRDFPEEWIEKERLKVIKLNFYIDEPLGAKYKKLLTSFNTYQIHKDPAVISANGFLLDGFNIVFIGKQKNRPDYFQIILENVICEF